MVAVAGGVPVAAGVPAADSACLRSVRCVVAVSLRPEPRRVATENPVVADKVADKVAGRAVVKATAVVRGLLAQGVRVRAEAESARQIADYTL